MGRAANTTKANMGALKLLDPKRASKNKHPKWCLLKSSGPHTLYLIPLLVNKSILRQNRMNTDLTAAIRKV